MQVKVILNITYKKNNVFQVLKPEDREKGQNK